MFGSTQGLGEVLQEQKCHFINKQVNKELYGSEVLKYVSGGSGSESTSVHLVSTRWLVSVPEVTVIYFISNFVQRMLRNGQILDTRTWSDI